MSKNKYLSLIIGILILSTGYFIYYKYFKVYYGYEPVPFESNKWKNASEQTRGYMFDDLLRKHKLKGMSEKEVVDLLGGTPEDGILSFSLGTRGFNENIPACPKYFITIKFKDGVVVDYTAGD